LIVAVFRSLGVGNDDEPAGYRILDRIWLSRHIERAVSGGLPVRPISSVAQLTFIREQSMKKLKLNVLQINVESFASSPATERSQGTVRGHEATLYAGCEYTTDRFDAACASIGIICGPSDYYSLTCDITSRRLCCQG
jgi:hypothetical protein